MPRPQNQIIDVDAPVIVDLTQSIHIDLTLDDDPVEPLSPPRLPRTKLSYGQGNGKHPGPPSSIDFSKRKSLPSTSRLNPLEPPVKRRRTDIASTIIDISDRPRISAPKVFHATRSTSSTTVKLEKRSIELDSDGEDINNKLKRSKVDVGAITDEEEEYVRCHAGYDINNEALWKPVKVNLAKITFDITESIKHLSVSEPPPPQKRVRPPPDFSDPDPEYPYTKKAVWDFNPTGKLFHPHPRPIGYLLPSELRRGGQYKMLQPMKNNTSFKSAPGCINRIKQSSKWVAISSAATGGQSDSPDGELDPYNKEGSIMAWNDKPYVLEGHSQRWKSTQMMKYYTVNDVKFDPTSSSFASSGNDRSVHIWMYDDDNEQYRRKPAQTWRYKYVPHELAFRPETSVLAVAERKIYLYSELTTNGTVTELTLAPGKSNNQTVGAMEWGRGPTSIYLFASSEPKEEDYTGYHKAFDAMRNSLAYKFDAEGSGDTMAVTEDGEKLVLVTRGEGTHSLRLYDIRNKNGTVMQSLELEKFPVGGPEGEVNSAAISCDGTLLALGRNDNRTHIYDMRFLKQNRLRNDWEHSGPPRINPGRESYGVVQVQWVQRDSILPFGLVTGGNDGCVRFWDSRKADSSPESGMILAETTSDIGAFSLGDCYKGERGLVVGDCSGEVSIFDLNPAGFHHVYR